MEKQNRIVGQIYGYFVCLAAVILVLTSARAVVGALVDLKDPRSATDLIESSLESLEKYRMKTLGSLGARREADGADGKLQGAKVEIAPLYIPDDRALQAMYESEKEARFEATRHLAFRKVFEESLLGAASLLVFAGHWMWLRKRTKAAA